ncbi:hypothetical protein CCO03_13450 [Comamonas serinivorans]|uniref:Long-chain fatty acid--CoA ligase n=1 Tax=Comamonas serinivorans TaxID=1082851 RepID=A0A1Y0EQM7_9BURK|nr:AMP-binding protein [Comamonas serinivorans]ARU05552.1 hypothetical protein CCO03_13450 [Comamonas serinivorans]
MTTPTLVEHWATQQPDRFAVISDELSLTWAELNTWADQAAHRLAAHDIGLGDIVALRLQTTPHWVVMMLAISKLQARLLGVNWRLVADEVNFVLENSRAKLLVLDDDEKPELVQGITTLGAHRLVRLSAICEPDAIQASLSEVPRRTMPELCAQVIYTSGTTGRPKGVELLAKPQPGNQRLNTYLADLGGAHRQYGLDDVILVSMPMHHGSGPGQVKNAIKNGATLVMQKRFDAANWFDLVERHGVTHWTGVPTMYKRLKAHHDATGRRAPALKTLGIGAAPVPMAIKHWVREQFGDVLHEGYGSSETGMITTMSPADHFRKSGSSGKPYAGVLIEIRDDGGQPCAVNEVGEIWVNTPVCITHYLNAPPLGDDTRDARGYFRTGDMGRMDDEGYLFITDRAKDMIISGGVNIYPAEIESAFYQHPQVLDIAVIGLPDEEFGEQVIAYYESKGGQPIADDELAAIGQSQLASYKRPRQFIHVHELPRNAVGKILKRELRQPHWDHQERNV